MKIFLNFLFALIFLKELFKDIKAKKKHVNVFENVYIGLCGLKLIMGDIIL